MYLPPTIQTNTLSRKKHKLKDAEGSAVSHCLKLSSSAPFHHSKRLRLKLEPASSFWHSIAAQG